MAKSKNGKHPKLADRFEIQDDAVVPANLGPFQSAVYRVTERASGAERALRIWKKTGTTADDDLRQLWMHERRQVQRLMATASGSGVVVAVLEFVEDDEEFAAVLEDAGRTLSIFRNRPGADNRWIAELGGTRNRILLWRNMDRIAQALGMLHDQGMIHGRVGPDVIMTGGGQIPDFKLTGFEWSLWFAAPSPHERQAPVTRSDTAEVQPYSFASDWKRLGTTIASLLNLSPAPGGGFTPSGDPIDTTNAERALLRSLVSPARTEALDASSVRRSIADILIGLEREGAIRGGTFILLVPDTCGLGDAAATATDAEIGADDAATCTAWAQADLGSGATLLMPKDTSRGRPPVLVTQLMRYELKPGEVPGGEPSWTIGYCSSARLREGQPSSEWAVVAHPVTDPVVAVTAPRAAREMRSRLGPAALDWSSFAEKAASRQPEAETRLRRALALVQVVEAVLHELTALPVEILDASPIGGGYRLALRAKAGSPRDEFARKLKMPDSVDTLHRMFEEERRAGEERWTIGSNTGRGVQGASFVTANEFKGLQVYRFDVQNRPEDGTRLVLRSTEGVGSDSAMSRRLRIIGALADQPNLMKMLENPWTARRSVISDLEKDEAFDALDPAKQGALEGILSTAPSYYVVGPPGVGKTHLATEFVRRKMSADASTRLLLTAQGHDALDNLQDAVEAVGVGIGPDAPLLIRVGSAQRPRRSEDSLKEAVSVLNALSGSLEASRWPRPYKSRIDEAAVAARIDDDRFGPDHQRLQPTTRATTDLLLEAANVVVATANSSSIERMVLERSQFDAVIVEEAAKATGPELIGALSLSGRHLLIGDHNQLPPFDAERFERILRDYTLTLNALEAAENLLGSRFPDGELADLLETTKDVAGFEPVAGLAFRMVQFFSTVVKGDETRKAANPKQRALSTLLNEQRRMHPAIAEIVSEAFYEGKLRTADSRVKSAYLKSPNFICLETLSHSPVVVVNVPHVADNGKAPPMERMGKRWNNPTEADAVLDILRLVRSAEGEPRPTLAILSPYSAQVELIQHKLSEASSNEARLLAAFRPARAGLDFVGTVDSFQGAEADLVIVSMVRNNSKVGFSALGFLRDRRRVNVLMSRAKSKLVLVTSLGFLRSATTEASADQKEELSFLTVILAKLTELQGRTGPDGIPSATVIPVRALRAAP